MQKALLFSFKVSMAVFLHSTCFAIVNGQDVTKEDWKNKTVESVVVQISSKISNRTSGVTLNEERICTGSILTPKLVLTAAHCFSSNGTVKVFQGRSLNQGPFYQVEKILKMTGNQDVSDFKSKELRQADVAILVLKEPIQGGFKAVKLPSLSNLTSVTKELYVIGYGRDSLTLRNLENPYYSLRKGKTDQFEFLDQMIKIDPTNGRPSICEGDSGGPLLEVQDTGEIVLWGSAVSVGFSPKAAGLIAEDAQKKEIKTPEEIFRDNPKADLCQRPGAYLRTQAILPWIEKVKQLYP